jgi:pectate lyase
MKMLRLLILWLASFSVGAAVPAFPGAQGGGAQATGGRGGTVYEVTSLADTNTLGTLRYGLMTATGARTIVFRVGGIIELGSQLELNSDNVTIAGQTAPGGGITLSGRTKGANSNGLLAIGTNNVIVRYIRARHGYSATCTGECGKNIGLYGNNIIVDHVSATWNIDEGLSSWGWNTVTNSLTFSYNLVGEGFVGHATSSLIGGSTSANSVGMTDIDYHHNLFMNNTHRAPLLKGKSSRIVNNIIYNHQSHSVHTTNGQQTDVIANTFKFGPLGVSNSEFAANNCIPPVPPTPNPCSDSTLHSPGLPSVYLSGNVGWHQANPAGDQWLLAQYNNYDNDQDRGAIPTTWRRATPLPALAYPITQQTLANAEYAILTGAGAYQRLDCSGAWVPNRDSVDLRLIGQYQNDTGNSVIISNESQVGGYPTIAGGTPCADFDHDGMPDLWEENHGYNANSPVNRNTVAANGYTYLENYLNGQ